MEWNEYPLMIRIAKETDVYLAMEEAEKIALSIGFDKSMSLKIKTAVSELARNILKYATRGRVEITSVKEKKVGIEIVVTDFGPGIKNIDKALEENYSSGGTLGLGLPGVKRLMDKFDIKSVHNKGTTITITKWLA
jgi:serine/threonine-protein kinase RsbT